MKTVLLGGMLCAFLVAPAFSQDIKAGEKEFRKCKACHMIRDADGNFIVKGGKTGPNLWNVIGRIAGSQEGFRYSDALLSLKDSGEVWTEENLAAFITDPNAWLKDKTGDSTAKTKMTFRLRKGQADIAAYLTSVSPDAPAE